jgi:two-component system, LytTR family, response regulator LytT
MNIVIIEDEQLTAKDLAHTILEVCPEAIIRATLSSVEEAIAYFSLTPAIDLIFTDIELGDGKSFEIFSKLNITIPLVFCTAYNEYAIKAFETNGIYYILKPFKKENVAKAFDKYKSLQLSTPAAANNYNMVLNYLKEQLVPNKIPNIIIHVADRIIPLPGEQVALFYIDHSLIKAHLFDNTTAIVSNTLDELEKKFKPYFFRTNRQYLINRTAITEASQHFNRKLLVHLKVKFAEAILVGKEKTSMFLQWLGEV